MAHPIPLPGAGACPAPHCAFRQALGEPDGDDRDQDQEDRDHVDDGGLVGAGEVGEDPEGEGLVAGSGGEGGDDDLVEGESEGEEGAGQQGRAQGGEGDQAEGLGAVGARDIRRRRARVLLNTTTMQKVAWPTTIVHSDSGTPRNRKADWRAIPVTIPGRAIGRTTSSDRVSRPKKRWRWTANDSKVPSTRATRVAPTAALTEVQRAARAPGLSQALPHHSVVNPSGGQTATRAGLKELITTTSSGT